MNREVKRRRWIVRKIEQGESVKNICAGARCSRASVYRWWNTYKEGSWEALEIKSTKPHTIHRVVDKKTKEQILSLRRKYGWGPTKIEGHLRQHSISGVKTIGHNAIYRILCSSNLNNPIDKPRKTWGKTRFEREHSNSLWQGDFKLLDNDHWMLTYMDDHSRFIVGSSVMWNPTTKNALKLFKRCTRKHDTPTQVLTDRGTQFYCSEKTGKETGVSTFTTTLNEMGTKHIVASVRRPTTTGKIENFHKQYQEEIWIVKNNHPAYIKYWNYKRPNGAIQYKYPYEVYYTDKVS
jgi:transposase InsO family protein